MIVLAFASTISAQTKLESNWKDQSVIYLDHSPNAAIRPVPLRAVTFQNGFWEQRREVTITRSIPTMFDLLEEHGVLDNFRRLTTGKDVPRRGPLFTDSDIYKWIEAAAYFLATRDHPDIRKKIDLAIDLILAAQEPSGYLNTYYIDERRSLRWKEMHRGHELYCLGHLLQGAIALYRATGDTRLLNAGIRFVDYLLRDFGPEKDKQPLLAGHPNIEMALIELYRITRNPDHLKLAEYILHGDPRLNLPRSQIVYMFSGIPFTSRTQLEGHAVRAMYACAGATDYFIETGNPAYRETLLRLWDDLVRYKMYVTGGVGSRYQGEAFGEAYELPNRRAYAESCAAIGNIFWNYRMAHAFAESRYYDILELALYNGAQAGLSIDGTLYCYRNPLAHSGDPNDQIRNSWYDVTCCPPNLQRLMGSLPGYFYSTSRDDLYVHLFHNSQLNWHLADGSPIRLTQRTDYPWKGDIEIELQLEKPTQFTLYVRIPAWSRNTSASINGSAVAKVEAGKYLALRRTWQPGDRIKIQLDMRPQLVLSNPRVDNNTNRVAVRRGPLIYAIEKFDQPEFVNSIFDVALKLGPHFETSFTEEFREDMLGGVLILRHPAVLYSPPATELPLYGSPDDFPRTVRNEFQLTLIPYYAFHNRGTTEMLVWIPYTKSDQ